MLEPPRASAVRPFELSELRVVNFVRLDARERLVARLEASGFAVFVLDGASVRDEASLTAALGAQVLGRPDLAPHWDRLASLLSDHLWSQDDARLALVWTEAHRMLDGGLADLVQMTDILTGLSRELYAETTFVSFLLGEGPNFAPLPE